jgi:dienelactone hydrolase
MKDTRRAFILAAGSTAAAMSLPQEVVRAADDAGRDGKESRRADATEVVKFQSASYSDVRQIVAREAPASTVTVSATLSFPDRAEERYPALVIAHTIGGYQDVNEGWHSLEFRKAGFATLTYDSFSARGISERAVINAGVGPLAWAVVDAFMALRLLARHPKIDPGRIAIVGFSLGGEVAHLTAFEWLRSIFGSEQPRFAAHVAYYPAGVYGTVGNEHSYTDAPVLMLLGEKDDNLPVAKIEDYLSYAKVAGRPAPIEVVVYPGALHAWTVSRLGAARFYPQYGSTRRCPLILLGSDKPAFLIDGQARPFDENSMRKCLTDGQGYSMAYDASIRAKSTSDSVQFLERNLLQ